MIVSNANAVSGKFATVMVNRVSSAWSDKGAWHKGVVTPPPSTILKSLPPALLATDSSRGRTMPEKETYRMLGNKDLMLQNKDI